VIGQIPWLHGDRSEAVALKSGRRKWTSHQLPRAASDWQAVGRCRTNQTFRKRLSTPI